ncbi:MAG: DNA polymerase III subunit [Pirellulales bacterium]|nr:DNA polymerase III subunit [Pirellulales bacterium]
MAWNGIFGHDDIVEQFRRAVGRGRLATSFLFVGPSGIGKYTFALRLARALLCQESDPRELDACGECESCTQADAGTHPDISIVRKPTEKSELPLELLIGPLEKRMREGLLHDIGLKPFMGGRKIAIIDDADYLNAEGANCLLKTLEEPPPRSVLILIGTSAARQLPTIRSRCQIVRFQPLAEDLLAELLVEQGVVSGIDAARKLAMQSEGRLDLAVELTQPEIGPFRENLLHGLAEPSFNSLRLSAAVLAFVEEAGREPALRRRRLAQVVRMAIEFYRQVTRAAGGAPVSDDSLSTPLVERSLATWAATDNVAPDCLDRSLEALAQIDRNVHQTALVECWMDDLARIYAS